MTTTHLQTLYYCQSCELSFSLKDRSEQSGVYCVECVEKFLLEPNILFCECCGYVTGYYQSKCWWWWCNKPICSHCADNGDHEVRYDCGRYSEGD